MKMRISRLSRPAALALLVALCLLVPAAPVLAGTSPWGAHNFNSRTVSYGEGPGGSALAQVVSGDPWASGTLLFWWDGDLNGHWSLSNEETGGTWTGTWQGAAIGAQTRAVLEGVGSGEYVGYSIEMGALSASGPSPLIMKGSYWLTD